MNSRSPAVLIASLFVLAACGATGEAVTEQNSAPTAVLPEVSASSTVSAAPDTIVEDEQLAWPDDPAALSNFEVSIGLEAGKDPLDVYTDRFEKLIDICMTDGGYNYGAPLPEEGRARLLDPLEYRGALVPDGCEGWALSVAYPGNYFGSLYFELQAEALSRPEYLTVLKTYDQCLISAGRAELPKFDEMTAEEAELATIEFNRDAMICDVESGLTDAQRAADVLTLTVLMSQNPSEVAAYENLLRSDGLIEVAS